MAFTANGSMSGFNAPPVHVNSEAIEWSQLINDINEKEPNVSFYGFGGKFANKYSISEDKTLPELQAFFRNLDIEFGGEQGDSDKEPLVNVNYFKVLNFLDLIEQGKFGELEEIPLIDVLKEFKFKDYKKPGMDIAYEEPDEDEVEFDEDCNEDCQPGQHTCGK